MLYSVQGNQLIFPRELFCASQIVQRLLKARSPITTRDNFGNSLFHGAAHGGNPLVFQALLDAGVDVSTRNGEGFTPLMIAAQKVLPASGVLSCLLDGVSVFGGGWLK